jgi:hypothetical protein
VMCVNVSHKLPMLMKTVAARPPYTRYRTAAPSFMDAPLISTAKPFQNTSEVIGMFTRSKYIPRMPGTVPPSLKATKSQEVLAMVVL